jgi:hypothetical protein
VSTTIELTGSFLDRPNSPERLRSAATLSLADNVAALLTNQEVDPGKIVEALLEEKETNRGYWRAAVATLVFATNSGLPLKNAPEDVRNSANELASLAVSTLPELFTDVFVQYCAERVSEYESASHGPKKSTAADNKGQPRNIDRVSTYPSSRIFKDSGRAIPTCTFNCIDDNGLLVFSDEFTAEDLIFLAHSSLSAARSSIESLKEMFIEGKLVRTLDEEDLDARAEGIAQELAAVIAALRSLPTM